jgi:hypothetical protein
MNTWRSHAAPIIAKTIKEVGYSDLKALRKALHEAYPFGPRSMHPYKIWCDEVRRQTQGRLSRAAPKKLPNYKRRGDSKAIDTKTMDLFQGAA